MWQLKRVLSVGVCVLAAVAAWGGLVGRAQNSDGNDQGNGNGPRKVFVIAMENHNWTQPASVTNPQQIFMNPEAPFLNSLVTGMSGISGDVAYATNYLNAGLGVHPSEPNYVWAEAGQAFNSIGTDADPYNAACTVVTAVTSDQHLTAFLEKGHKTWRSYQEDVNVDLTTNTPLPMMSWISPIFSSSGNFMNGFNAYDYSTQYNYAAKHNPMVFFTDTNGGCPAAKTTLYPPLQQLALDLQSGNLADYTWITPNQFNDMHTTLTNGYGGATGAPNKDDRGRIAQGDNFLARVVPMIMASDAYKQGAAIVLWWDESEGGDTAAFTLPFFVISKNAHANVGGLPFASAVQYSHSSFLRTMQDIFNVDPQHGYPYLGAAATANDISAMFRPGAIK